MSIILKDLDSSYIDDYFELVNDLEVHKTTEPNDPFVPFEKDKLLDWLNGLKEKKNRKDFAIVLTKTNEFVGEVVLNHIENKSANIRIAILPRFFNKGYGTEAMKQTIDYAFKTMKLEQITLGVFSINPRGVRVYEKSGFVETSREKLDDQIFEINMVLRNENL